MATQIINSWKINKYPVSADTAHDEFERIYNKYGELTQKALVDESRDKSAVLHECFEWNDAIAAEKYRLEQAGDMIRCLVSITKPDNEDDPIVVRAFVKTTEHYEPIRVSLSIEAKYAVLLNDALQDAENFKRKYENFVELKEIIDAIDSVAAKIRKSKSSS